ncbi:hypothetical protein ACFRJ9_21640 [Paenarthrobacter sp. NPDC056912]|uniref:hypothetical protein n=1 Tax=Paenarthrobacter sp. NPDC056912 TaxID=3345965 RepID=UPI00366CAC3C
MSTYVERDRPNGPESSVCGRACEACTFDESVTSYDAIPDAQGWRPETGEVVASFPGYLRGLDYCTNCYAVYGANGHMDRELTAVFRAGLDYIRLVFEKDPGQTVTI